MMTVKLICDEVVEGLRKLEGQSVDMTLTSPPYDSIRDYKGTKTFVPHLVASELQRVTKPGGVVVWIVGDQVIEGSESGSSFRHVQAFRDCGFNLHDTMIYERRSPFPDSTRYHPSFEYMFVFSLGRPKTFNPIHDKPNIHVGSVFGGTERQRDGRLKPMDSRRVIGEFGRRANVWKIPAGNCHSAPDKLWKEHPAIFPLRLAHDHILSWSNPGDHVLDCFGGSGQTAIAAMTVGRECTLIEVSQDYLNLASRRIDFARDHAADFKQFCERPLPCNRTVA